jgi:hypothetical protein
VELIIGNLRIYAALNNRQVTAHPCCEGRETEFRAQTIRPKTPARYNWSLQRLEPERQSPPIRSYSPAARKSPQTRDCVVVDAAQIEPVSTSNSLLAGNLAGNFLKKRLRGRFSRLKRGQDQSLMSKFPAQRSREFFYRSRELYRGSREFCAHKSRLESNASATSALKRILLQSDFAHPSAQD